jgi:hypothetical protein
VYGDGDEREQAAKVDRARARGEAIRAELMAHLTAGGPQDPADLLPSIETPNVSLPEVGFQLDRLVDDGTVGRGRGRRYRAA